jgi:hypothetical protein
LPTEDHFRLLEDIVGKHDKPNPSPPPNDPPGSGDGVPEDVRKSGGGDRKK